MYKITAGAHKLDAGVTHLTAGAGRLDQGASQLHARTGRLTAGFATLGEKLNSRDPNNPGVLLDTQALATGASKLADGNARTADGRDTRYSSATIYPPTWWDNRIPPLP